MNSALLLVVALILIGSQTGAAREHGARSDDIPWQDVTAPANIVVPDTPVRKGFTVRVENDPSNHGISRAHYFILHVFSNRAPDKPPVELSFTSLQATFKLAFADVTGDGVEELVTICTVALETEQPTELLQVWVWNQAHAPRILDLYISGYVGSERWWYEPDIRDLTGDGVLDLALRRGDPGRVQPAGKLNVPPRTGALGYAFNSQTGRMEQYLGSGGTSSNNRFQAPAGAGALSDVASARARRA